MKSSPNTIRHCLVDTDPPNGGRVSSFTLKPSPNMAYSVLFTACLFRMVFGNSIGGLALFQCGVKRGTAVAKVRVKLTDSSRKQGLTDKMLMTWTMTHHLGIHHKHASVLKHMNANTNKRAPDLCGIVSYLTDLMLLTTLTTEEVAKCLYPDHWKLGNFLSIKWSVHPNVEILTLFTHPCIFKPLWLSLGLKKWF